MVVPTRTFPVGCRIEKLPANKMFNSIFLMFTKIKIKLPIQT